MNNGDLIIVTRNMSFSTLAQVGMKGRFLHWCDGVQDVACCRFDFGTYYMAANCFRRYPETPFDIDLHDYLQSELG